MQKRILWVDRMRGLAMLSVVIQHLSYYFPSSGSLTYINLITVCNMGVFFFVSGYIIDKTSKINDINSFSACIKKKFLQLMVPFFFWGILSNYVFSRHFSPLSINEIFDEWEHPTLWYLLTLFGYVIPFAFYKLIWNKKSIFMKILFWIIWNAILFVIWKYTNELKFAAIYLPFFTLGVIVSEYDKIESYFNNKWLGTFALISILLLTNFFVSGSTSSFNSIIKIILTVSAVIALYQLCNVNWNKYIDSFISQCGLYSIAIYAIHWYFLDISFIPKYIDTNNELIVFLISTFIGVIISYVCIFAKKTFSKYYILDGLMFGGKWSIK